MFFHKKMAVEVESVVAEFARLRGQARVLFDALQSLPVYVLVT